MKLSASQRVIIGVFKGVNKVIDWHKLPKWFGILNLLAYRYELRGKNLHDVYPSPEHQGDTKKCPFHDSKFYSIRNNKKLAKEISDVYNGDIEKVDLQVGMLSEPLPKGFGFSDTAFRIFILMASRRLKSDRFLSSDFKPEIYTKPGMNWVQHTTMKDVLIRHFAELRAPLRNVKNAFHPWDKV